jgi:hypothetical protein
MGVAGGSLAAQSLARSAMAAGEGVYPRRFLTFITPCGHPPGEFWPSGAMGPHTGYAFKRVLKPLDAFKSRILLTDTLNIRFDGSKPGDQHQQGTGKLLTGANLLTGPFGGAGISPGWSTAASLDQVIAAKLGTKLIYAGVQVTRHNTWSRYSHIGPDKPNTPVGSPAELHRMLFSEAARATPGTQPSLVAPVAPAAPSRKASVDFLLADTKRLRDRLGGAERAKLDEQLDFLNLRAKKMNEPVLTNPEAPVPTCVSPVIPMTLNHTDNAQHGVVGRLLIDNMVAAMRCDVSRVGVLQWSQSISDTQFTWILPGQSLHHHSLTHQFNGTGGQASATLAPMAPELFIRASTWYMEQFKYLLEELDKVKEGDGTMLDNTVVFLGADTNGFEHGHGRMQFLLAGGCGGKVKTGRWVSYVRNHNDLLVGIANAMGVPMDTFGEKSYHRTPIDLSV